MIGLTIVELGLRLAILILEGVPPELRKAQALLWWGLWKPFVWPFLDESTRAAIEEAWGSDKK